MRSVDGGLFITVVLSSSLLTASNSPRSEDGIWCDPVTARLSTPGAANRPPSLSAYRIIDLNRPALLARLANAPLEGTQEAREHPLILTLPEPGGTWQRFRFVESPILEPLLAVQFPEILTYAGQGIDDPSATLRFDVTPLGLHAMILSERETIYIAPQEPGDLNRYISYFRSNPRDFASKTVRCLVDEVQLVVAQAASAHAPHASSGTSLRTYRAAIAATAEYTAATGGTLLTALSTITTALNRVSGIYERDLAIRFVLVANEPLIIYTNAATDPYTNGDPFTMLGEAQRDIDARIGSTNYDIGQVFATLSGSLAGGSVCIDGAKASAVSSYAGDSYDPTNIAHEIGHQFGANHTFNADGPLTEGCNGNRVSWSAFEPGSGSTIMAYTGACAAERLQPPPSDDYFHVASIEQILSRVALTSCATPTPTGNSPPTVSAGGSTTIPSRTPFTLTATASDPNGDPLTFTWEQYDLGAAAPPDTDDGTRAIFRSFKGTSTPSRTFPKLSDVLTFTPTFGESLPTTTRSLTFRVTARDNRSGGGGRDDSAVTLSVAGEAGPFSVLQPLAGAGWIGGKSETVTWAVAGTSSAPVNCGTVNIFISLDGGNTFPTALALNVPNSGSASVMAPNVTSTSARVRVSCASNVFFNVNPGHFTVTRTEPSVCTPSFSALCLNSSRFRIEVAWKNPYDGGTTGVGRAVPLTSDSGYFWFFASSNIELVIKILDGRAVNGKFWVLYGALSDVEYTITITDTQTGFVKTFFNPGRNLASVADVDALPGSRPSPDDEGTSVLVPVAYGQLASLQLANSGHEEREVALETPTISAVQEGASREALAQCTEAGDTLCLNTGRFQIRVAWRNYDNGSTGSGFGVRLTDDSGYFWFFNSANVELVLKVLDGRTTNGKFWLFYGALSDVEYTVTATDTLTGTVKIYYNPPHVLASVADTNAFSGAPEETTVITLPGGVRLALAKIPAGTFMMGSPATERGRSSGETLHQVTLTGSYYIGKYGVTQEQWQAVMGSNPASGYGVGPTYPVYNVSWNDIAGPGGFLEKLNQYLSATGQPGAGAFRLPTEAERERAARAGTQTRFSFGDALECDDSCGACAISDRYMWWCANWGNGFHPVGQKEPNGYGLFDMHGNLSEWCQDWYGNYPSAAQTNPTGPSSGSYRMIRGGASGSSALGCRSAIRLFGDPVSRSVSSVGFRLARSQ